MGEVLKNKLKDSFESRALLDKDFEI